MEQCAAACRPEEQFCLLVPQSEKLHQSIFYTTCYPVLGQYFFLCFSERIHTFSELVVHLKKKKKKSRLLLNHPEADVVWEGTLGIAKQETQVLITHTFTCRAPAHTKKVCGHVAYRAF